MRPSLRRGPSRLPDIPPPVRAPDSGPQWKDPRIDRQQNQQQHQNGLEMLYRVLAKLAIDAGGSSRVIECGTCLADSGRRAKFREITLPNGPIIIGPANTTDEEPVISYSSIPHQPPTPEQLDAWLSGISPVIYPDLDEPDSVI
jgi:hypothetical protein